MKSLYCKECGEYLMAGSGSLIDCSCGWKQPMDEGIDAADYEALQAERDALVEALEDIGASWHGVQTELEKYMRNVARRALADRTLEQPTT